MPYKEVKIVDVLRKIEMKHAGFGGMIAGAFVLWLAKKHEQVDIGDLQAFLKDAVADVEIRLFLLHCLENHWKDYRKYITTFESDELKKAILNMSASDVRDYYASSMPNELKDIVINLLDIRANDYVADFGAGTGDFLCYAQAHKPEAKYWGNELGTEAYSIAKIRSFLIGEERIKIVLEDMFAGTVSASMKFDKCFCFPPLGMRFIKMSTAEKFLDAQDPALPTINGNCSSEWLFALKMLSCMKKDGCAVLLMPIGGLFNSLDNSIRKYFLERKMIKAVVRLPGKTLVSTSIPTALVVFCDRDNEKVTLIDASNMSLKENELCAMIADMNEHKVVFDKEQSVEFENTRIWPAIINGEKIPYMTQVDYRDIIVRGNMDPSYYLRETIHIPHPEKFSNAMKEIFRGALISSTELNEITIKESSSYRYLSPGGIQNGVIVDDLPYLSDMAEKYKRYSVRNGDLVITKIGSPFKVALAEVPAGQTIIANGNVFVLRLNENNADRHYIKAFLESRKGQALLSRIAVGSVAPMLNISVLKNMLIPLVPLTVQKTIGEKYRAKMDEIAILKRRLEKAVDSLNCIIDDELEG